MPKTILTAKEKVLGAILHGNDFKASTIARVTNLSPSMVYKVLEQLMRNPGEIEPDTILLVEPPPGKRIGRPARYYRLVRG